MLVPNLLVLGLAAFGDWNIIREDLFSFILCAASQGVLWQLVRRTLAQPVRPVVFLAMSIAFWNAGQAENFAVGFQMQWFLVEFGVLVVVWRLTAAPLRSADVALAAVAATAASFSLEAGLLAWPVGLLAMVLARGASRGALFEWLVCGVIVYGLYRTGFVDGGMGHVPLQANIGALVVYSLAYLGVPVAYWAGLWGSVLAGLLLLLSLVGFAVLDAGATDSDDRAWRRSAPWYALAAFAVIAATGTGPSRLGLGLSSVVTTTRYITVSLWLSIAVIAIAAQRLQPDGDADRRVARRAAALIVAITCATAIASARGIRDWQHFSWARQADVRALRSGNDAAVAAYYTRRDVLEADIRTIRALRNGPLQSPGGARNP